MVIFFYLLRFLNRSIKVDNNAPSDEALRAMMCIVSPRSSNNTFCIIPYLFKKCKCYKKHPGKTDTSLKYRGTFLFIKSEDQPTIPDLSIPSTKFFCKKIYITSMGRMDSKHPDSIHTSQSAAIPVGVPVGL